MGSVGLGRMCPRGAQWEQPAILAGGARALAKARLLRHWIGRVGSRPGSQVSPAVCWWVVTERFPRRLRRLDWGQGREPQEQTLSRWRGHDGVPPSGPGHDAGAGR